VVVRARERSQVRDEQRDIFQCHFLVFLEIVAEPAGGEAPVAFRLVPGDQRRQLERLGDRHAAEQVRVGLPTSNAEAAKQVATLIA
jgi:hypothetical protein